MCGWRIRGGFAALAMFGDVGRNVWIGVEDCFSETVGWKIRELYHILHIIIH